MQTLEQAAVATPAPAPVVVAPAATGRRRAVTLRPGVVAAGVVAVALLLATIVPQLFAPGSNPYETDPANAFASPSLSDPFGTDQNGRDTYTRVVYGTRESLLTGVAATALALLLASALGLLAGLRGGRVDAAINRLLEVLFAFPGLLLALLLFAVYGGSVTTAIFAVGIATAPGYARLIRAQALAVRSSPYVEASRALGHSPARIVRRTIFPNAMRPLVALTMMGIGQSIVWVSSLSFLGLGAQPPAPEWGSMLAQGRDYVSTAWWLALFPGLAIVTATVAFTVLGRYLQQRAEGRLA